MRLLLDLCALIELRSPKGNAGVKATIALVSDDDLYVSALTVGEISRGVALLPDGRKKRAFNGWLNALERQFAHRILPIDPEAAHLWGEITARLAQMGQVRPVIDTLVAATALRHGLGILTCHAARFEGIGVLIVDPWKASERGD